MEPQPDPRVIADLEACGVDYELLACDPELADTAAFCAAYGIPLEQSANTILVASRRPAGVWSACLVLASTRLDVNGTVRRKMGVRKVSFSGPEETVERTGMLIGGVTAFGLPADMPLWIDAAVMVPDWVIIGAGSRSAKIRLNPSDLLAVSGSEVVDGLARPVGVAPSGGAADEEDVPDDGDDRKAEPLDGV
jgi:prolyl-tRNA editing enzyme YbaK/EbsC (Cys-tRNA(Pro) deacylase)